MFLECFIGLTEVTKESCCYGYPVTKENKMANEYLRECHALCFIENRKGISQIYRKIEESIQFIHFFAKLGIKIQLHLFLLKQVIWKNALLDLIRAMFIKMDVTQLIMGLSEKFFRLHDPQTHYFIPFKGPGSNGLEMSHCPQI